MFDEEDKISQTQGFQKLDTLSVSELEDYVKELQAEIVRAEQEIKRKRASMDVAGALFK